MPNLAGHLDAVKDQVGGGQQMGQRFLLHAVDAALRGLLALLDTDMEEVPSEGKVT